MTGDVLVAVLSLIGSFFGTFGGIKLMTYRIEQLEHKVEKHNSVVERMAVIENRMDEASRRISTLESEAEK